METNGKAYELCNGSSPNNLFILSSFIIKILVQLSEQALENAMLSLCLSSSRYKILNRDKRDKRKEPNTTWKISVFTTHTST